VLGGEQSNTSIVYDMDGGPLPFVIAKVFRVLHHGENPDVTTQAALTRGGSHRAPPLVGYLTATWPDPGRDGGTATGHLAFAQEFLPGLDDAWRVALRAAADVESFADRAYDLGIATAEVHATLARVLSTTETGRLDVEDALGSMRARLRVASNEVPGIAASAESIEAVYTAAASGDLPRLQRIHGDLHLGQALLSPDRGWMLIDFEGEPLRPMDERSRPDSTLRDIAGMLRSFDYVAGSLAHTEGTDARDWASEARRSYVDGYIAASGFDVRAHRLLLDAFELDKAVYEAVYESRSRPTWVGIPLAAIERLVARSAPMPG
jgi:predicted trehalose synthase